MVAHGIDYKPRAENDRKFDEYDIEEKFYEMEARLEIRPVKKLTDSQMDSVDQKTTDIHDTDSNLSL